MELVELVAVVARMVQEPGAVVAAPVAGEVVSLPAISAQRSLVARPELLGTALQRRLARVKHSEEVEVLLWPVEPLMRMTAGAEVELEAPSPPRVVARAVRE